MALPPPIDHDVPQALVGNGTIQPGQYPDANLWGPFVVECSDGGKFVGTAMRFDWDGTIPGEQVSFAPADENRGIIIYQVTDPPEVDGDTMTFVTAEHGPVKVRPVTAADVGGARDDSDAQEQASEFFGLRR